MNQLQNPKIQKYLNDNNVLNIYQFGSFLYGSQNCYEGHISDEDYIIVAQEYFDSNDINIHVYTYYQFKHNLSLCDIQMMECYFAPDEFKIKETVKLNFTPNPYYIRKSTSTISSTSWVKGKKKLTISADYDLWLAIKSIYHSLRILNFGYQILLNGKIVNFSEMNYVLYDMIKMSETLKRNDLWEAIDTKYRQKYNSLKSEIKKIVPKEPDSNYRDEIKNILSKYRIDNEFLLNELCMLL